MNKKFTLLLLLLSYLQQFSNAQIVQACLDTVANKPNAINIWLRSDLSTPIDTGASTLQFCIAIPDTFSGSLPTSITVDSSRWTATWQVGTPFTEGGFICYPIFTATSPLYVNFTAFTDYFALRIGINGGTATPQDFYLICLPDGGAAETGLFYMFGAWYSEGSQLFYARPNTTVNNQLSYDLINGNQGTGTSWAKIQSNVAMAIHAAQIEATWIDDDALIKCVLQGEVTEIQAQILQKSYDGYNFFDVVQTNTAETFMIDKDEKLKQFNEILYYRIKILCVDNNNIYSNTSTLTKNTMGAHTNVFPIPCANNLNIRNSNKMSQIAVYSSEGRLLQIIHPNSNVSKLNTTQLADGNYTLRITIKDSPNVEFIKFIKAEYP
jgi:hypothetical protein